MGDLLTPAGHPVVLGNTAHYWAERYRLSDEGFQQHEMAMALNEAPKRRRFERQSIGDRSFSEDCDNKSQKVD
jgi:hypothetical protein